MAIKYMTPDDSPADPGGLIKQALDMGAEFPGPAEDVLLAWTLRLAPETDPAEAARQLLELYGAPANPPADTPYGRLIQLLHETGAFGRDVLARHHGRPARRGGRRRPS